jgi:hypothetical protein
MRFTIVMNVFVALLAPSMSLSLAFTGAGCKPMFSNVSSRRTNSAASRPSHIIIDKEPSHFPITTLLRQSRNSNESTTQTQEGGGGLFSNLTFNPTYTIAYLVFFSVATYMTTTETPGASQEIIEKFIASPLHPNIGSSLFAVVFNTLGLIGLPLACLIMPGSKGQRFNPTPFLFGSAAAGYGSLGLFMMTRKPVASVSSREDLGWFTRNVLENKVFNWALVVALANIYWITGAGESLLVDAGGTFDEFRQLIDGSALGFVSTVDLMILCLTGASLIPEDLERRGVFKDEPVKAYAVAASTLLLPAVGLALYSALRPSLLFEDE